MNKYNTLLPWLPKCKDKEKWHKKSQKSKIFCAKIADHKLTYKGCQSTINQIILKMLIRSVGIRDIADNREH